MKKVELVIFDMDGLLFNTEQIAYEAMLETMNQFGVDFPIETYKKMIGMRDIETDQLLLDTYGEDFPLQKIFEKFREVFAEIVTKDGLGVKPGVEELLQFLDNNRIKKCIASSSKIKTIEHYLQLSRLTERFDFYISGEEVANGKPAPDIFIEACGRAGVALKNAVVLEDSLNGFLAAYRANIDCIVVPDMIEPNEEMKQHATFIVPTLHDVIPLIK